MMQLDFGPLYKFLTSAGVALLLGAALLPWAIMRESTVLLLTTAQLAELTPGARETLLEKQRQSAQLTELFPEASIALILAGLTALFFGLYRWNNRQKKADLAEDKEIEQKYGLAPLTATQQSIRLDAEVAESVEDADNLTPAQDADAARPHPENTQTDAQPNADPEVAPQETGADSAHEAAPDRAPRPSVGSREARPEQARVHASETQTTSGPIAHAARRMYPVNRQSVLETRHVYGEVEATAIDKVSSALFQTHKIATHVYLRNDGREADMVAAARSESALSYVFEVKYSAKRPSPQAAKRAIERTTNLAVSLQASQPGGPPFAGVVLWVVGDEESLDSARRALAFAQREDFGYFGPPVAYVVMSRDALASVAPRDLRHAIEQAVTEAKA